MQGFYHEATAKENFHESLDSFFSQDAPRRRKDTSVTVGHNMEGLSAIHRHVKIDTR